MGRRIKTAQTAYPRARPSTRPPVQTARHREVPGCADFLAPLRTIHFYASFIVAELIPSPQTPLSSFLNAARRSCARAPDVYNSLSKFLHENHHERLYVTMSLFQRTALIHFLVASILIKFNICAICSTTFLNSYRCTPASYPQTILSDCLRISSGLGSLLPGSTNKWSTGVLRLVS